MATLALLRSRVARKIGLDDSVGADDRTFLNELANEGVREVLLRTRVYVDSATLTLTPGTSDYRLDAGVLLVTEAYISSGSTPYPIELRTPKEILDARRSTGADRVRFMALQGHDLLMVYPTPSAADVFTFYYVPKPTEMSADGNDPSTSTYGGIPVQHLKAVELYMLAEAGDYDDDASSQNGDRYRALFEAELVKIRRSLNRKLGRLSPFAIPPRGRLRYRGSPDQVGV